MKFADVVVFVVGSKLSTLIARYEPFINLKGYDASGYRQATGETDEGEYRRGDVAAQTLCICREQCRLGEAVSERVTGWERTRSRLSGNTTLSQTNLDHSLDFWPKIQQHPRRSFENTYSFLCSLYYFTPFRSLVMVSYGHTATKHRRGR